jgi:hypothetical protein
MLGDPEILAAASVRVSPGMGHVIGLAGTTVPTDSFCCEPHIASVHSPAIQIVKERLVIRIYCVVTHEDAVSSSLRSTY